MFMYSIASVDDKFLRFTISYPLTCRSAMRVLDSLHFTSSFYPLYLLSLALSRDGVVK